MAETKVMKYGSLVLLTLQNVLLILCMRHSRTQKGDLYISTTAVILAEAIKVVVCLFIILMQESWKISSWVKVLGKSTIYQPYDFLKISVPSVIYTLQNNLLFIAVSNLEAATFQITYQLKILTTALFSVLMLRKRLTALQWLSLLILFFGVAIVQLQPNDAANTTAKDNSHEQNIFIGLTAVLISSFMSGFAGVYFEKILKGTKQTIWVRNVQLGIIGVFIGTITMLLNDGAEVRRRGFLAGYNWSVWAVVMLQSFGGLMVAVVVKYADNILKAFATSAAIIISCIASVILFNLRITLPFGLGAILVISSVYMYGKFAQTKSSVTNNLEAINIKSQSELNIKA